VISGIKLQKETSESSVKKNVTSKASQTAKTSAASPSVMPRSAAAQATASLVTAAGLPADKLSASVVSFARFFFLPLKPQLLADIRRQAFVPQAAPSAATQAQPAAANSAAAGGASSSSTAVKIREAFSLSAAAAESKGVELQPKGLESYAEAVDPHSRRQDGQRQRNRQNREQNEQAEKTSSKTGAATADVTAGDLKKIAIEYMSKNPYLDILNKLPGKNGQRWIVLPFDFCEDDREFNVSIRILLNDKKTSNRADYMALDIAESGDKEKRWLFVMESANEKPVRLSVHLQPELPLKAHSQFKGELSRLLDIPIERIFVKPGEEPFPFEANCGEMMPSIDEAV